MKAKKLSKKKSGNKSKHFTYYMKYTISLRTSSYLILRVVYSSFAVNSEDTSSYTTYYYYYYFRNMTDYYSTGED